MDIWDDFDFDTPPEGPEPPHDAKVEEVKRKLISFFDEHPEEVYYERQLEVLYESEFFHWITARALSEIRAEGLIESELVTLSGQVQIRLFRKRQFRYWKRKASELIKLVRKYSTPEFTAALGERGESLFDIALPTKGFMPIAANVRSFQSRSWTTTEHNLDRLFIRDGVVYGAEIKNTLPYIRRDELLIKLSLCQHLGIKPLFIMRYAPKSYIELIRKQGGFSLIFKYQLYPFESKTLADEVRNKLGLPVDAPRRIADGTTQRFLNWHIRQIGEPH